MNWRKMREVSNTAVWFRLRGGICSETNDYCHSQSAFFSPSGLFWGIGKSKHAHTSSQGFSLCPLSHRLTYGGHALNCWAAVVTVTITTRNEWRGAAKGWNASSTFGLRCRVREEKWALNSREWLRPLALPEHGERMKVRGHFVRNSRWFGACCASAHIESICQAGDGFLLSRERGVETSSAVADLGSVVPRQITSAAFTRVVVGSQVIWSRSKVLFTDFNTNKYSSWLVFIRFSNS